MNGGGAKLCREYKIALPARLFTLSAGAFYMLSWKYLYLLPRAQIHERYACASLENRIYLAWILKKMEPDKKM
jgi:hypothetical protein